MILFNVESRDFIWLSRIVRIGNKTANVCTPLSSELKAYAVTYVCAEDRAVVHHNFDLAVMCLVVRSCVPFTGRYKGNEPVLYSDPFLNGAGTGSGTQDYPIGQSWSCAHPEVTDAHNCAFNWTPRTHIYIHVCMYICMYVCAYIHTMYVRILYTMCYILYTMYVRKCKRTYIHIQQLLAALHCFRNLWWLL